MIAVKRLQSLFWVLLVALGALGAYLVSLRVATERNELMHVRSQIVSARADIRYLETEFAARSSIRQLERWNADDFRYSARAADQYLDGERALAHLDGVQPNGPAYVAPPVMVAMIDQQEGSGASAATPVASPATLQIRSDAATIRAASAGAAQATPVKTAQAAVSATRADARTDAGTKAKAAPQNALARKAERMAMLDARLLDERTLGDIGRRAVAENGGKQR
ncbi:MAG: colicin transporter [Sphingomonadales bacterium]|nr:MAG: colicin transporter [Sphingomonadales bacterium]TNF02976.1 MAG: colicin transporter [Sphingomonadales bacterium]